MMQAFAEVLNQASTTAAGFARVILYRLDPCLSIAAALPNRTPVDRPPLRMQLTTEALRGLENVAGNADLTVTLVPDALE